MKSSHGDYLTQAVIADLEKASYKAFMVGLKQEISSLITETKDLNRVGPRQ